MPTATKPKQLRDAKGHFINKKTGNVHAKSSKPVALKANKKSLTKKVGQLQTSPQTNPLSFLVSYLSPTPLRPVVNIYSDYYGEWHWDLVDSNGKVLAGSGENYVTKWGCRRAARKFLGI